MSEERHAVDEPPPIFKSWNSCYAIVLGALILLILLFYLFTLAFHTPATTSGDLQQPEINRQA